MSFDNVPSIKFNYQNIAIVSLALVEKVWKRVVFRMESIVHHEPS